MERKLETSLRIVIEFLNQQGYHYAIIGGIALSHWGVVRATYDVDIKVLVPDNDYPTVRNKLLTRFSQQARPQLPSNSLIVAVTVDDVIVDFLLALPGYEELIIERAIVRDIGGWSARVCTAEDLIIQKVIASRDKDWLDVESLLMEQPDQLDEAYIEEWLIQFAEALENESLLTRYRSLLKRVQTRS